MLVLLSDDEGSSKIEKSIEFNKSSDTNNNNVRRIDLANLDDNIAEEIEI